MSCNNTDISIPWVEKYRPSNLDDIVLDHNTKTILNNIINRNCFPNLLFYGPPGTGKTTTIVNIINKYQQQYNEVNKSLIIHLNASDDRGIDTVRNQIRHFVCSDTLFVTGTKFVILDEVDYMTKQAQQSLKYLIQYKRNNVRFCLVCNYISRIDNSLQGEFMRLRFNQLPDTDILAFLRKICINEQLNIGDDKLMFIQKLYKSDIRSMVNYLQFNKNTIMEINVLNTNTWLELTDKLRIKDNNKTIVIYLKQLCKTYNVDIKHIIKDYLNYIIIYLPSYINIHLIEFIEFVFHVNDININYLTNYTALFLNNIFSSL